jgi:hypothetical protein
MKRVEHIVYKLSSSSFYWNILGLIPYGQTALLVVYELYKRLYNDIHPTVKIIKFLFKYKILGI